MNVPDDWSFLVAFWREKATPWFCEEIWTKTPAESLLIRTMAIAYMEVGNGRKQDAEALSASDYLSLKYIY